MQFANPTNIRIIFHLARILQMKGYTKLMNGHNYGTDRELLTSGSIPLYRVRMKTFCIPRASLMSLCHLPTPRKV